MAAATTPLVTERVALAVVTPLLVLGTSVTRMRAIPADASFVVVSKCSVFPYLLPPFTHSLFLLIHFLSTQNLVLRDT